VRVVMRQTNGPERGQVTDFATGFQHPLPVMVGPDGGLLVGDYGSGRIYEIRRLG